MRDLQQSDMECVEEIHKAHCHFAMPDFDNRLYCCNKVVTDGEGNVVGVGTVRLTSETILIVDRTCPTTVKTRAIQMLLDKMRAEVRALGMDETHAFVDEADSRLRRLLVKAFGFLESQDKSVYLQF